MFGRMHRHRERTDCDRLPFVFRVVIIAVFLVIAWFVFRTLVTLL
jgi:hypothetical protein